MKIYVQQIFPITTLADVIACLYRAENGNKRGRANSTFFDEFCTQTECHPAYRSFEDILCIAQTYFPDTTEVDLMQALIEEGCGAHYCKDIHKFTFFNSKFPLSFHLLNAENLLLKKGQYYIEGTYLPERLAEIYNQAALQV